MTDLYKIKNEVIKYFNLTPELFDSKTRDGDIVKARQMAMRLSLIHTKHSLVGIGKAMGGKDHATVLHSKKTVDNHIETERQYAYEFDLLDNRISVMLNQKDIVTVKATITLKDSQYSDKWYYTYLGMPFCVENKIHTVECSTIKDALNGFNINEVERIDIEIINKPVTITTDFKSVNEPIEIKIG